MHIIAKSTLKAFWEKHNDAEVALKTWHKIVEKEHWKSAHDIKKLFGNASIVSNNRIVFNIKGNAHRLIVKFNFEKQWIFIRFVGTHAEYDKVDASTI